MGEREDLHHRSFGGAGLESHRHHFVDCVEAKASNIREGASPDYIANPSAFYDFSHGKILTRAIHLPFSILDEKLLPSEKAERDVRCSQISHHLRAGSDSR